MGATTQRKGTRSLSRHMFAALRERVWGTVMERSQLVIAPVMAVYDTVLPYVLTGFQHGFVPLVVFMGYITTKAAEPRLRIMDLISPM